MFDYVVLPCKNRCFGANGQIIRALFQEKVRYGWYVREKAVILHCFSEQYGKSPQVMDSWPGGV